MTSKHAIIGLTKSLAMELGPNIRCNGIAPGLIDTPMVAASGPEAEAAGQAMVAATPMKRKGLCEDIAYAAVYLASDESTFVDGQILRVDGGEGI